MTDSLRLIQAAVAAALLAAAGHVAAERTVTDSAGREVAVPETIDKVYAAGHPAAILIYTLAPEVLVGWTRGFPDAAKPYIAEEHLALPELGRLTGRGDTANIEVVLREDPDLVVDYGYPGPPFDELADTVQARSRTPMLLLDGSFEKIPEAYRKLGEVLGREERAEKLAAEAERILAEARELVAGIPEEQRPRVYYARGTDGLDTGLPGSINVEALEMMGARNVAAPAGEGRTARVSMEQILAWNPEVIITITVGLPERVAEDRRWQGIEAVERDRVYRAPELPFGWFDRPPSVNRLLGLPWLAHLLYPEHADGDLEETVRDFYALFYHHRLTDEQLEELLDQALPR